MAAAACAELIRATYPSLDEEIVSYVGSEWTLKLPHYCYSFMQLRIHTASVGLFKFVRTHTRTTCGSRDGEHA